MRFIQLLVLSLLILLVAWLLQPSFDEQLKGVEDAKPKIDYPFG